MTDTFTDIGHHSDARATFPHDAASFAPDDSSHGANGPLVGDFLSDDDPFVDDLRCTVGIRATDPFVCDCYDILCDTTNAGCPTGPVPLVSVNLASENARPAH